MRFSALLVGGLAAGVMAAPAIVTRTVNAVQVVTVTAAQAPASTVPQPNVHVVTQVVTVGGQRVPSSVNAPYSSWQPLPVSPLPSISEHHVITLGKGTVTGTWTFDPASTTSTSSFETPKPALTDPTEGPGLFAETGSLVTITLKSKQVQAPAPSYVAQAPNADSCQDLHPDDPQFCQDVLDSHNIHRRNHSAPDIKWSKDLFHSALLVASNCNFSHFMDFDGGNYGQNLLISTEKSDIKAGITNGWYNSEFSFFNFYGQATPKDMADGDSTWERYSHFTQVIWAASKEVGCAEVFCPGVSGCRPNDQTCPNGISNTYFNSWLTVCNYKTPGNVLGAYAQNVGQPQNRPPVIV
ncbi:Scp-like extracellular protein [Neofusicoccum parvum]|uniref:Scp-like extracellular protein n=1 Tax=Neofusicoccum parvum TaxID=310453 RepID=A0ACB5S4R8_9PEZI|nr:Scp-like extracellular protein [Neofusicoccum parvum]GME60940.1 Scp-like extracellular protein [Neofusicoccum parvum]